VAITLDQRSDFTLPAYRKVAWDGEPVRIGPAAITHMAAARASFMALLESDRTAFIYGTTTGGGPLANTLIPPEMQREHARRRGRSSTYGFGGHVLADRVTRGIVFARLVDFVEGHAKTRPEIAQRVAALLDRDSLPSIPLGAEVSAGEIILLAHVMSPLRGDDFQEGEYGPLLNGSPCSSAFAADVALQAAGRLATAERVLGLSIEAMNAPLEAYHPALKRLWGDPYAAQALDVLQRLLPIGSDGRRPYQAPVSYRVLPRVLGQAHRAVAAIGDVAATSLRSVTLNPAYVPPAAEGDSGLVLHTGGYHNAMAYPAIDQVTATWADLCTICDRHTTKLHKGDVSLLPDMLAAPGQAPWSGTARLGFLPVGFGERVRNAAVRTQLPYSEGGGYGGQDDVALPTSLAYEREEQAGEYLDACLAILAAAASQALHLADRTPGGELSAFLDGVRSHFAPVVPGAGTREQGDELGRLAQAFGEAALGRGVFASPATRAADPVDAPAPTPTVGAAPPAGVDTGATQSGGAR
jgi:histidine ammonia-lyase